MESPISPSQHIYKLYRDFEKRGMDTAPISQAIQQATGTSGMSNIEVVEKRLKEMMEPKTIEPF